MGSTLLPQGTACCSSAAEPRCCSEPWHGARAGNTLHWHPRHRVLDPRAAAETRSVKLCQAVRTHRHVLTALKKVKSEQYLPRGRPTPSTAALQPAAWCSAGSCHPHPTFPCPVPRTAQGWEHRPATAGIPTGSLALCLWTTAPGEPRTSLLAGHRAVTASPWKHSDHVASSPCPLLAQKYSPLCCSRQHHSASAKPENHGFDSLVKKYTPF